MNLLRAWDAVQKSCPSNFSSWVLAIAGWDQGGHEAELQRLACELGIAWAAPPSIACPPPTEAASSGAWLRAASCSAQRAPSLLFLGPQFGDAKAACYQHCDACVLPSLSEGLPVVILEAWAGAKPVLMTPECNLPDGFCADAARRIDTSPEGIASGLRALFQMNDAERQAMGQRGLTLVKEHFTWPKVGRQMRLVYEWVLGGGPAPACVKFV